MDFMTQNPSMGTAAAGSAPAPRGRRLKVGDFVTLKPGIKRLNYCHGNKGYFWRERKISDIDECVSRDCCAFAEECPGLIRITGLKRFRCFRGYEFSGPYDGATFLICVDEKTSRKKRMCK